jgi:hypothetical protein
MPSQFCWELGMEGSPEMKRLVQHCALACQQWDVRPQAVPLVQASQPAEEVVEGGMGDAAQVDKRLPRAAPYICKAVVAGKFRVLHQPRCLP